MLAQVSPRSTTLSLLIFIVINYEKDWLISLAGTYPESSSAHLIEVISLIWAALLLSPSPGEEECSGLGGRQHSHRASPCHPQAVAERLLRQPCAMAKAGHQGTFVEGDIKKRAAGAPDKSFIVMVSVSKGIACKWTHIGLEWFYYTVLLIICYI